MKRRAKARKAAKTRSRKAPVSKPRTKAQKMTREHRERVDRILAARKRNRAKENLRNKAGVPPLKCVPRHAERCGWAERMLGAEKRKGPPGKRA